MSGSSAGAKPETLGQQTRFETDYFGPPIGHAARFIECLVMNKRHGTSSTGGLSSDSFVPEWELLRAEGMPLAAATVPLPWHQRTLRTKDLPIVTLKIMQDTCSVDEPPREVQATLTYKLVEILGDILVFPARLEARLPANSEVMKVLLCDNIIKTLVQKVFLGTDDELKLGKALLRHVFCSVDESVDKLKPSITTACTATSSTVTILKYTSTVVHPPVSLSRICQIGLCTLPTPRHLISCTGFQR